MSKRRGKKRKLAAAFDVLSSSGCENVNGSGWSFKKSQDLQELTDDQKDDQYDLPASASSTCDVSDPEQQSLVVKTVDSIIPSNISGLTLSGLTVLTAQAINLVPRCFFVSSDTLHFQHH